MAKPRKPDYRLKAFDKTTERAAEVGAAWKNDTGSISIVLNPCVVLTADSPYALTLFPVEEKTRGKEDAGAP